MRVAAARTANTAHPARTIAPRYPRRISGPARPVRPVAKRPPAVAAPARRVVPIDRLLRGRAWIWVIGVGLMGIVAMQVSLLKLNTGISRAVQTTATLERQNAQLEQDIARYGSNERISRIAGERGMIAPDAGQVQYLRSRPPVDAKRAVDRMRPPSTEARSVAAAPAATASPTAQVAPAPTASPVAPVTAAATPGQG